MSEAEVRRRIAEARAEAARRVPQWRPWMRQWCLDSNWGELNVPMPGGDDG